MFNRELINQNKNITMCVSSFVFMLGILAFFNSIGIIFSLIITFLLLALMFLNIFSFKKVLFLALIFYFGFFISNLKVKNYDDLIIMAPINSTIEGRIISIPVSTTKNNVKFRLQVEKVGKTKVNGKTFVNINADNTSFKDLNIGQNILISGNLRKPFSSTNPSQFDYSAYLRNFNIFTVFYSNEPNIKILDNNPSLKWKMLALLNNTRRDILKVHSKFLKSPNLEILGGIVFGDDAVATPEYIKNSFIHSGLLHILAASGMNVAFIFAFWSSILWILRIPFKIRTASGIFVILLYTLMTGLGPSVVRAALMLIFVLIGKLIDRDANNISLLSLVAVLLLIYNPAYINDVSFQLSFLVTFGLITTGSILSAKLDKIPNWIKIPIIIPLVAQIWVIPIQMFYFNTVSLYSIFANIATVNIVSIISFSGFVSSILAIFKPAADIVCMIFDFANNYFLNLLVYISDFFANLPNCIINTVHPEIYQIVLYYAVIVCATYLLHKNKFKQCICTLLTGLIIILFLGIHPISQDLEIITFDVKNADCFLIKTPQNKYFMIDTGKSPYKSGNSQAKIIVLKYLKDRGIKTLEGLIVTHFDNDHSGGVVDILENIKVNKMYLNNEKSSTLTAENIFKTAKKVKQPIEFAKNNTIIYSEPDFYIKNYISKTNRNNSENDSSIMTKINYKKFGMLFMGDAGTASFDKIKNPELKNTEVLKVGHHGGANVVDRNMINYLKNETSLISTGINHFGHPNKGTLDILRNTKILRTDALNSIKISSDGIKYKIYTYNPNYKKYILKDIMTSR